MAAPQQQARRNPRRKNPRRRTDDIQFTLPGGWGLSASGATVTQLLLLLAFGGVLLLHDMGQDKLQRIVAVVTCVLTLTDEERKEFRIEGRYCGDYETNSEIRQVVKPEAKK